MPRVLNLRQEFAALQGQVYLNTGTAGPLPRKSVEVLQKGLQNQWRQGRAHLPDYQRFTGQETLLREKIAELVHVGAQEVVLTHNTSEGLNIALWGIDWRDGDEVVTTTLEHEGVLVPLYQLARVKGIQIRFIAPDPLDPQDHLDLWEQAITRKTRAVVFSHVSYGTGGVLPAGKIASVARAHNILSIVDGAQAVGALPVDVTALGVDAYAFPAHKWLCGPEGLGALVIRREAWSLFSPTFTGFRGIEPGSMEAGNPASLAYFPDARRYEVSTVFRPAVAAWLEGLAWFGDVVGWNYIFHAVQTLQSTLVELLNGAGYILEAHPQSASGLVAFHSDTLDVRQQLPRLFQEGFIIRGINSPPSLRVSCGFFNTASEIENLVERIAP